MCLSEPGSIDTVYDGLPSGDPLKIQPKTLPGMGRNPSGGLSVLGCGKSGGHPDKQLVGASRPPPHKRRSRAPWSCRGSIREGRPAKPVNAG
jgi:hypothetical protein